MLAKRVLSSISFLLPNRQSTESSNAALKQHQLPKQAITLACVDLGQLSLAGIKGVILDLDNTIVSEDDRYLSPGAEIWIQQAKQKGFRFFVLSNGKRQYRVDAWRQRLEVPILSPAKKPFPKSFRRALLQMELAPHQVVVIGDSCHTDVLGAWLVGCFCIQVTTLPHPPRWWEKLCGRLVQIPYPVEQELWDMNGQPAFHPNQLK
ncbi:MAG: YqeG family HAD IIIA-type phosphatase [Scytolyngbya sp. HA4215-MV1]|jgi:hypothetical protein|nr:YqeG family HAD IIIA-type phosphatase [Scytolyngbya sp. HA4215-MV1]